MTLKIFLAKQLIGCNIRLSTYLFLFAWINTNIQFIKNFEQGKSKTSDVPDSK